MVQRLTQQVLALRRECVQKDRLRFAPHTAAPVAKDLQGILDEKLQLAVGGRVMLLL